MKKGFLSMVLAIVLSISMLGGCSSSESSSESSTQTENGNILVVADTQCPTSLDPAQSWDLSLIHI